MEPKKTNEQNIQDQKAAEKAKADLQENIRALGKFQQSPKRSGVYD